MSSTRTSGTQEPPPTRKGPKKGTATTNAGGGDIAERLETALELLAPLIAFHEPVEGAREHDLRIYWDVRVVRGRDSHFAHVEGTSSLPMVLAPNMKALAPSVIQEEILEKIAKPLTAVMQAEVERLSLAELAARRGGSGTDTEAADQAPGEGAVAGAETN